METTALIQSINKELALALPEQISMEQLRQQLAVTVNHLIEKDFQQLVQVLYRVDVNERKLKYLLQENVGEDAAAIIADLIIERQLQKINSRSQFGQRDDAIPEDEKW
jgi:stress response protein SCP2